MTHINVRSGGFKNGPARGGTGQNVLYDPIALKNQLDLSRLAVEGRLDAGGPIFDERAADKMSYLWNGEAYTGGNGTPTIACTNDFNQVMVFKSIWPVGFIPREVIIETVLSTPVTSGYAIYDQDLNLLTQGNIAHSAIAIQRMELFPKVFIPAGTCYIAFGNSDFIMDYYGTSNASGGNAMDIANGGDVSHVFDAAEPYGGLAGGFPEKITVGAEQVFIDGVVNALWTT